MSNYLTAQDLVHHLLSSTGGGAQDGEHSAVRMAVVNGVREVMQARDWLWHTRQDSFTTLASATPPRTLLPENVKTIDTLVSDNTGALLAYISPQEYLQLTANNTATSEPFYYTILRSETYPDRYEIKFVDTPIDGLLYYYTYRYRPQPIKYMGYESAARVGTIAITSGSAAVTGTGTEFPTDAAGRVLRVGTVNDRPEPIGSLTPYREEHRILSRASNTGVTLAANAGETGSGLHYAITDEIDVFPQMWSACLSAVEMWYARMAGKSASEIVALFNRDLRLAMEADAISPMGTQARVFATPRTMGWHSNLLPDNT